MPDFSQVFSAIADRAHSGADASGDVADWLISAGLSVAAVRQILNGVATSAQATPQIVAYAQDEMRYAFDGAYAPPRSDVTPLLILAAVLWFASRD